MQPRLKDGAKTGEAAPDPIGVVHILAVPEDINRLQTLAHALRVRGLIPWRDDLFPGSGPIPTSSERLLKKVQGCRQAIGRDHPELPVVLLGLNYGGLIAATLAHRVPGQYGAVAFWDIPETSWTKRVVLLALLYWERFRLGSDVPSLVLRQSTYAPMPIGAAIACLRLGRKFSTKVPRTSVPARFFGGSSSALFDSESQTYGQNPNLFASELNQNISDGIADWFKEIVSKESGDQVA